MKTKLLLILLFTSTINCSRQSGNEAAEGYFNKGKSKAGLKNYWGAIADFSKAIEIDSTFAAAYYFRGDAMELLPKAEADSALASNPKSAEAYYKRGNARAYLTVVEYSDINQSSSTFGVESFNNHDLGESTDEKFVGADYLFSISEKKQKSFTRNILQLHQEAIKDFIKATKLDSTFEKIYKDRGIGEVNRPDYQGAIEDYTKAIELKPNYKEAYQCRGFAKYEMKDYRGAIEDYVETSGVACLYCDRRYGGDLTMENFNTAIALDPKFAAAYWGRGDFKVDDRDFEGAKTDYDKARELDPKYVNMTTALENQELEQNERAKLIDTTSIIQEQEQDEEPVYAPLTTAIGLDYGYGYGIANAPVATVGSQAWLGKNLNVDHFANGDPIPEAKTDEEWKRASENKQPAWCYYNNDPANGRTYGKLYNWYAVNDPRGLAPRGWHIPSDAEWTALTDYLGGETTAGLKMKSTSGWNENGNGNNNSGIAGLPDGYRGPGGTFYSLGKLGYWWSSSEDAAGNAWTRSLDYNDGEANRDGNSKSCGFSVRCLRD